MKCWNKHRAGATVVTLLLVGLFSREGYANCKIEHYIIRIGEITTANWTITNGSACVSNFKLAKTSKYSSVGISSKPSHGIAGSAGVDSIAYRPEPGFKGSDAFVVRVEGHGKGKPGEGIATVRIYVQVE
jgi:hypothetical protein